MIQFFKEQILYVLSLEKGNDRKVHTGYYLPKAEINDYDVLIDGNFFDEPVKGDMKTYDNIKKVATDQGDDYTTGLLDYNNSNKHYKMAAIDLSKQQALDADPKAIQQISITGNLHWAEGETMFVIMEEATETILAFSHRAVKIL